MDIGWDQAPSIHSFTVWSEGVGSKSIQKSSKAEDARSMPQRLKVAERSSSRATGFANFMRRCLKRSNDRDSAQEEIYDQRTVPALLLILYDNGVSVELSQGIKLTASS